MYQVFRVAISLIMMVWDMTPNIKSLSHNSQSGPYDGVEMGGATCKNVTTTTTSVTAAASTIQAGCGVLFLLATALSLLHDHLQVL